MDIRIRRQALGLTMKAVADLVGVSEATISRWESGDIKNMKRDRIVALAKALKCQPTELLDMGTVQDLSAYIDNERPIVLTPAEREVIKAYREHPEMQEAIKKLLGI